MSIYFIATCTVIKIKNIKLKINYLKYKILFGYDYNGRDRDNNCRGCGVLGFVITDA